MNQEGIWLSILDYAAAKKTSISTIRRSIKAGHVKHKEENGKYFIWTKSDIKNIELPIRLELEMLKRENKELREEINDMKMLLSVYETQGTQNYTNIPPIPVFEI